MTKLSFSENYNKNILIWNLRKTKKKKIIIFLPFNSFIVILSLKFFSFQRCSPNWTQTSATLGGLRLTWAKGETCPWTFNNSSNLKWKRKLQDAESESDLTKSNKYLAGLASLSWKRRIKFLSDCSLSLSLISLPPFNRLKLGNRAIVSWRRSCSVRVWFFVI